MSKANLIGGLKALHLYPLLATARREITLRIDRLQNWILHFGAALAVGLAKLVGWKRSIGRSSVQHESVLVLPPWSPESLGDEAVEMAFVAGLRARGVKQVAIVSYTAGEDWSHLDVSDAHLNMRDHCRFHSWKDVTRLVTMLERFDQFCVLGADVMDGAYDEALTLDRLKLTSLAAMLGLETSIVNFSFREQPSVNVVQVFRDLPSTVLLCARDMVSRDRLAHHIGRPVQLAADVAFLLEPIYGSIAVTSVLNWISSERVSSRAILGLNVGSTLLRLVDGLTAEKLAAVVARAAVEFAGNTPASFVLIPHSFGANRLDDPDLAQATVDALPEAVRQHCLIVPRCSAPEIKAICGELDLVSTGRMHVAIACLGQGTPVVSIVYQGKFEGLYEHFELDSCTIDPLRALQPGELAEFWLSAYRRRGVIREQIRLALPGVLKLAKENFAGTAP